MNRVILLVEDDENDVLFLTMALKSAELANSMHVVKDGREAMDYFQGTGRFSDRQQYPLPYLVLLDLKIPHVPGLEVLKWLREQPISDSTMVIVLTSSSQPEDIDAAY